HRSLHSFPTRRSSDLVALNTALYTSGIYLSVPKNKVVSKPIQIVHIATGDQEFFAQTRNLYILEANAEAEIIESFITLDNTASKDRKSTRLNSSHVKI